MEPSIPTTPPKTPKVRSQTKAAIRSQKQRDLLKAAEAERLAKEARRREQNRLSQQRSREKKKADAMNAATPNENKNNNSMAAAAPTSPPQQKQRSTQQRQRETQPFSYHTPMSSPPPPPPVLSPPPSQFNHNHHSGRASAHASLPEFMLDAPQRHIHSQQQQHGVLQNPSMSHHHYINNHPQQNTSFAQQSFRHDSNFAQQAFSNEQAADMQEMQTLADLNANHGNLINRLGDLSARRYERYVNQDFRHRAPARSNNSTQHRHAGANNDLATGFDRCSVNDERQTSSRRNSSTSGGYHHHAVVVAVAPPVSTPRRNYNNNNSRDCNRHDSVNDELATGRNSSTDDDSFSPLQYQESHPLENHEDWDDTLLLSALESTDLSPSDLSGFGPPVDQERLPLYFASKDAVDNLLEYKDPVYAEFLSSPSSSAAASSELSGHQVWLAQSTDPNNPLLFNSDNEGVDVEFVNTTTGEKQAETPNVDNVVIIYKYLDEHGKERFLNDSTNNWVDRPSVHGS